MLRPITFLVIVAAASSAPAYTLADFVFTEPGLAAVKLYEGARFFDTRGYQADGLLAGGALLGVLQAGDPTPQATVFQRLNADGTLDLLFTLGRSVDDGYVFDGASALFANASDGTITIVLSSLLTPSNQVWRIQGLPRTLGSGCPTTPGDVAPGTVDELTDPDTFRITGDGNVDVGDAVVILRAAVGLHRLTCTP